MSNKINNKNIGNKLILLALLILFSIIISSFVLADNGCCANPAKPGSAICQMATSSGCCGNDSSCISAYYYLDLSCDKIPGELCNQSVFGVCMDNKDVEGGLYCKDAAYKAQCYNKENFIPKNYTVNIDDCKEGCCLCANYATSTIVCAGENSNGITSSKRECENYCSAIGMVVLSRDTSITQDDKCKLSCSQPKLSNLSGKVTDSSNNPIAGAKVSNSRYAFTDAAGNYKISDLFVSEAELKASKEGFVSEVKKINITLGQNTLNFILKKALVVNISGTAIDKDTKSPIQNAIVFISGIGKQAITNSQGKYSFANLNMSPGQYTLTASLSEQGYSQETKTITLTEQSKQETLNFELGKMPVASLSGIIKTEETEEALQGVVITLFSSEYPVIYSSSVYQGAFNIKNIPVHESLATTYTALFAKDGFFDKSAIIKLSRGESSSVNISLTPMAPGCGYDDAVPVKEFKANHVPGKKSVLLTWIRPCSTVAGYYLYKQNTLLKFIDSSTESSYLDNDVNWGSSYSYSIKAVYKLGGYKESSAVQATITLGDKDCEDKFNSAAGRFDEFCTNFVLRKTCSNENKVIPAATGSTANCSELGKVCVGPNYLGYTECKSGNCGPVELNGAPFGLYYTAAKCYGADLSIQSSPSLTSATSCYYDYSNTIVDKCDQCSKISSCFDYSSGSACLLDNRTCSAGKSNQCGWIDVFAEIGKGICYEKNYLKTDKCSMCSHNASIFFNVKCSQETCSRLGSCYSNEDSSSCYSCQKGETKCEDLKTQQSCGASLAVDCGIITSGKDACSLGVCRWTGTKCIKDADADGAPDCADTDEACKKDTIAPVTTPPNAFVSISSNSQPVIFTSSEAGRPGGENSFFYCIYMDSEEPCCPEKGDALPLLNKEARLNLISDLSWYKGEGYYIIKYYSIDNYYNRESVKSRIIYADLDAPKITISYNLKEDIQGSTLAINLTITEEVTKSVICTDSLQTVNFAQSKINNQKIRVNYGVAYDKLADGVYIYSVNCRDDVGNEDRESLQIIINADKFISINYPKKAVHEKTFRFNLSTKELSTCILLNNKIKIEDLQLSGGYYLSKSYAFEDNTYYSTYSAECGEHKRDIPFAIDNKAPETAITAESESKRFVLTQNAWSVFFDSPDYLKLSAACADYPENGFGCKKIIYCKADTNCIPSQEWSNLNNFNTTGSFTLCYYSIDEGDNKENVKCGRVSIKTPLQVKLIYPQYGVSKYPKFDLTIETDRQTDRCAFAYLPEFDFNTTIKAYAANTFEKIGELSSKLYVKKDFPGEALNPGQIKTIYIKCNDSEGNINEDAPFKIDLSYDPSAPLITKAYLSQDSNGETETTSAKTSTVYLVAKTDDKAKCRYTSGSNDNYGVMADFPVRNPNLYYGFSETNIAPILITSDDNGKSFTYTIKCMNRAEKISDKTTISFGVDFNNDGIIYDTKPSGVLKERDFNLSVRTTKEARCQFSTALFNYGEGTDMISSQDRLLHKHFKSIDKEGKYNFPVICKFALNDKTDDDAISFIVDKSAPEIYSINVSDVCDLKKIKINVDANDSYSPVSELIYNYTLKKSGFIGSELKKGYAASAAFDIDGLNLSVGESYIVEVVAVDSAGNSMVFPKSSNVFKAKDPKSAECKEDKSPPDLKLEKTSSDTGIKVKIICSDLTECINISYGVSPQKTTCSIDSEYKEPVMVTGTKYFCYSAYDKAGNKAQKIEQISASGDSDNDGIPDADDKCPFTPQDERDLIDTEPDSEFYGCSPSERDSDNDGILNINDKCPNTPFNERDKIDKNPDSEFYGCSPSEMDSDKDGVSNGIDQCPETPQEEQADSKGCSENDYRKKWKLLSGIDLNVPGEDAKDPDKDKLTNYKEFEYWKRYGKYIDPNKKDTDEDRWNDKEEIDAGTDPTNPDSYPSSKAFAISLFIIGFILIIFGVIYLVYMKQGYAKIPVLQRLPTPPAPRYIPRPVIVMPSAEDERRRRAIELLRQRIKEKRESKRRFFDIFSGSAQGAAGISEGSLKKIAEAVNVPKSHLEKIKGIKLSQIPERKQEEFSRLKGLIGQRFASGAEISNSKKQEIKNIFSRLAEFSEQEEKKRALEKLKNVTAKSQGRYQGRSGSEKEVFGKLSELIKRKHRK